MPTPESVADAFLDLVLPECARNGEIVTLEIPLPLTPYPIKVRAIVRYRQGLRYGFEFLTLNEAQRDTIRRVCQYLATKV